MPTTNPVPSQDPSDLLFNAGKLDEVLNGTGTSFTDRLGTTRRTVAGMNADFDAQLADAESDLNVYRADAAASAAEALGYLQTIRATSYGAYASDPATDPLGNPPTVGDEYFNTTANLLKRWNGTTWQASDINTANLAAPSGSSLIGYDTGTVQDVLDGAGAKQLQDYTALRAYTGRAKRIYITGLLVTAKPAGIAGSFQHDQTDTTSADNGGTIIVGADGRRWKRDYSGAVNVKWFNAFGIDSGDDAPAIIYARNAAGVGGELFFPKGVYPVYQQISQLQSQKWIAEGGQRAVTIKKMFNGDLFVPASFCTVDGINFHGNGVNYTGRGIYVPSGFSIRLERVRVDKSHGVSLEFADGVGGGSHICDFEASTTNPGSVPAIKIKDTSGPAPKFFYGIWLSGGLFDLSGGGNGSSITNFYVRNFITSAPGVFPDFTGSSGLFHISNGRVASIADTTVLSGADATISNVAFSGPVVLDKAQGYKLAACTFGAGISETPGTCRYNSWGNQPSAFATSWYQDGGTPQPSIGNGSLVMWINRSEYSCHVFLRLVVGSTTTFGNSGVWKFSIPFNGHLSINQKGFIGHIYDPSGAGATKDVFISGDIGASENCITFGARGQGVRPVFPITWFVGSVLEISFNYLVA